MKDNQQDTPPSSLEEISSMEQELNLLEDAEEFDYDAYMEEEGEMEYDSEDEKEPPEDNAILVFKKHAGSVFCCDIHPDGKLAVTGGEDDRACVWSVDTGEIIMDCTGHKDSIVMVGFSFDGAYLATGDMAGLVKVWKVNTDANQKEPWQLVFENEADDISWGQWHFGARVLFVGVESGDVYVFKIPSGDVKILKGHKPKVECGKLLSDGVRLVVGYEDGAVKLWDLKTSTVINQIPSTVHQSRVTAVDAHPDGNLVASISNDGKVILATSYNAKVVGQLDAGIDLEAVAFSQEPVGYFALGTLNGGIGIWDVARQMMRHQCAEAGEESGEGVTKMIWIKNQLVAALLDGSVRVFDGPSGAQVNSLTGHQSAILDLCYNAKQNLILTTSDDKTARLFKYEVKNVEGQVNVT